MHCKFLPDLHDKATKEEEITLQGVEPMVFHQLIQKNSARKLLEFS